MSFCFSNKDDIIAQLMSKPTVFVFAEFLHLEKLRALIGSDADFYIPGPCNGPKPELIKTNIKIFYGSLGSRFMDSTAATSLADRLIASGFCRFVTDQLYSTDPETKKTISLLKDRIILEACPSN
jgi:hypothetical protein